MIPPSPLFLTPSSSAPPTPSGGDNPSPSKASAPKKKRKRKQREGSINSLLNWKETPSYSIRREGGTVVEEREHVIFKIPDPVKRKETRSPLLAERKTRYGEMALLHGASARVRPIDDLRPEALQMHRYTEILKVYEAERAGMDLSSFVVQLALARQYTLPLAAARLRLKEMLENASPVARCETIPALPPFDAFSPFAPIRPSLRCVEHGTKARPLPQQLLPHAHEYIPKPKRKADIQTPVIEGLEALKLVHADNLFHVESIFNYKQQGPDQEPVRCSLLLPISILDVHIINTHAETLWNLSGLASRRDEAYLPAIVGHFTSEAFCRTPVSEALMSTESMQMSIFEERFPLQTAWNRTTEAFAEKLIQTRLPSAFDFVLDPSDRACFDKLMKRFEQANPGFMECTQREVFLQRIDPTFQQFLMDEEFPLQQWHEHLRTMVHQWIQWRYFLLPDLVAAAFLINYHILHPSLTKDSFVRCPGTKRVNAAISKRVCVARRVNDPAEMMLFEDFMSNGFDVYGSCLLLYRMICGKKVHQLEWHRQQREAAGKQDEPSESSDAPSSSVTDVTPSSSPPPAVFFRHWFGYEETLEDMEKQSLDQEFWVELYTNVSKEIPRLYEWCRYPSLCSNRNDYGGALPNKQQPIRLRKLRKRVNVEEAPPPAVPPPPPPPPPPLPPAPKEQLPQTLDPVYPMEPSEVVIEGLSEIPAQDEQQQEEIKLEHKLLKSIVLGKVVPLMPREKAPAEKLANLETCLRFFEENFTLIGPRELELVGKRASKRFPKTSVVMRLILAYLTKKQLFPNLEEACIPDLTEVRAFIVANRTVAPGLERYTHSNKSLLFFFKPESEVDKFHKEALVEEEKAKEEARLQRLERKKKREEERKVKRAEKEKRKAEEKEDRKRKRDERREKKKEEKKERRRRKKAKPATT